MSELVLIHHNEPMTTSLAIAEGVQMEHKSVLQLLRKYLADFSEWGEVAFQMRLNPQGSPTEFAYLNEGQAMFLMTLMRNSEIVVAFKKALVKGFLELRDRVKASQPAFTTQNLSHGADLVVAADRTFRGFLRSARSSGMSWALALQAANRQTIARTGTDMLHELGVVPEEPAAHIETDRPQDSVDRFVAAWQRGETRYPYGMCRNTDLLAAYCQWCAEHSERPLSDLKFHCRIGKCPGLSRTHAHIGRNSVRVVLPLDAEQPADESKSSWTARCLAQFRESLN